MNELVFFFNTVIVSGVVLGSIYAIGAIGVTLIFGILRFAHFAHGDMMTAGGFISFILAGAASAIGIQAGWPTGFIVLPLALPLTALLALGLDRAFYRPLRARGAKPVTLLIASIGVTLMLQGVIRLFFGAEGQNFHTKLMARMGFEEEALRIQSLFFEGRRDEAIAAVPDDFADEISLVGPPGRIRERLTAWEDSPVTTLLMYPSTPENLRAAAELVL